MQPAKAWADFDASGMYRYELGRVWDPTRRVAVWIMLNPSAADASSDDPTMRRVTSFTHREGFGGFVAVNLSAYCAAKPTDLRLAGDRLVEAANDGRVAMALAERTGPVIAAWGAGVERLPSRPLVEVIASLADGELWCLGITKAGHPKHPLYLPASTSLVRYELAAYR